MKNVCFPQQKIKSDIPDNSTTQNFIVENYTLIYYIDYKIIFLIKKSIIKYIFSYKSHVKIIKHSHSSLCALKYLKNKTRMDLMEWNKTKKCM